MEVGRSVHGAALPGQAEVFARAVVRGTPVETIVIDDDDVESRPANGANLDRLEDIAVAQGRL